MTKEEEVLRNLEEVRGNLEYASCKFSINEKLDWTDKSYDKLREWVESGIDYIENNCCN